MTVKALDQYIFHPLMLAWNDIDSVLIAIKNNMIGVDSN